MGDQIASIHRMRMNPARRTRTGLGRPSVGVIALTHLIVCLWFTLFAVGRSTFSESPGFLIRPVAMFTLVLFAWSLVSWRAATGVIFDPYCIFLTIAHLFNAGQIFLHIFGLNKNGILGNEFTNMDLLNGMLFVATGLAFFHLGALLIVLFRGRPSASATDPSQTTSAIDLRFVRMVGWAMLAVSVPPFLILMRDSIQTVLSRGYLGLYEVDPGTGIESGPRILASFLIPATIFLLVSHSDQPRVQRLMTAIVAAYALTYFFLGYRGISTMPLIAYGWAYHRTVRRLGRKWLLPALGLIFVVLPTIRVTRNAVAGERQSFINAYLAIDNPVVSLISEFGGSFKTVIYTQQFVPTYRGYDHGQSFIEAFTTVIPSLFWPQHPAIANGTLMGWVTMTAAPYIWAAGGGIGYSFIAETYLNFGWFGGIAAMFALGAFFSSVFTWGSFSADRLRIGMVAAFLSFLAYYARGEAIYVVRPLVWYVLLPAGAVWLLSQMTSKRGRHPVRSG